MTNEIKEILDWFYDEYPKETKKLEKYITNLQKENEKYKKIFEGKERFSKIMPDDMDFIILSKADYDRQQEDIELTAIKMKQRIDKAVEYIKEEGSYHASGFDDILDLNNLDELLDILRGDE